MPARRESLKKPRSEDRARCTPKGRTRAAKPGAGSPEGHCPFLRPLRLRAAKGGSCNEVDVNPNPSRDDGASPGRVRRWSSGAVGQRALNEACRMAVSSRPDERCSLETRSTAQLAGAREHDRERLLESSLAVPRNLEGEEGNRYITGATSFRSSLETRCSSKANRSEEALTGARPERGRTYPGHDRAEDDRAVR